MFRGKSDWFVCAQMSLHRPCRLHCGSLLLARVRPIEPRGVKLLAHDEERRIAANIAKLPDTRINKLTHRDTVYWLWITIG